MASENLKVDENHKPVAGFVTDDSNQYIKMGRIDDTTKGMKVMIVGGAGLGTVTSISQGTGILLSTNPLVATGTVSLATALQPLATLAGNSLKFLRVNAGETAVEYVTETGLGTVTSVSVTTANGVSGSVATETTTPAITLTLGAITPTTVNGLTITANGTNTLAITAGKTLTVLKTISLTSADDTGVYTLPTGTKTLVATDVATLGSLTSAAVLPWTGLKPGTDGEIPTFDSSGNPAFVATGTATHVLTSNGAGAAPTFQAAGGGGSVTAVTVSISSANILGMFVTPVEVLAAPGAGKVRIIDEVVFSFTVGTQYANGGNVRLQYDGDTANILNDTFETGSMTGASSLFKQLSMNLVTTTAAIGTDKAIKITNASGAFITGTGTLKLFILYRDITL